MKCQIYDLSKKKKNDFFGFLFRMNQPEVETLGPRFNHVVSNCVLHRTVLIANFRYYFQALQLNLEPVGSTAYNSYNKSCHVLLCTYMRVKHYALELSVTQWLYHTYVFPSVCVGHPIQCGRTIKIFLGHYQLRVTGVPQTESKQ